jgi:hypothetical protein
VLALAAPADAKKKKKGGAKKGKTPSGKTTGKTSGAAKAPVDDDETDEASSDEKEPTPSKSSGASTEDEKPSAPLSEPDETAAAAKKPAKPVEKPAEADDSAGSGQPALTFGIGGRALFRNLSWTDNVANLAPYTLSPGPEVTVWGEVYPAAFMTSGFAANIGVFGHFNYGFGASSKTPSGTNLTTKYQDFLVGLKVRIPLGMVIPYVVGAYGLQSFNLEPFANDRPNFTYAFVKPGAGVRIQATPMFDIDIGGGYLVVTGIGAAAGDVKSSMFLPRSTAAGVDFSVSFGVRFSSLIGVRAGADLRQYGLSSNYVMGGPGLVVGGSTDRYITAWGGVEILLDGVGGGPGGGGEEEAAPAKKAKAPEGKAKKTDEGDPFVDAEEK